MQWLQEVDSFSNSLATQLRAAPMPRLGSVVVEAVWRVPNDTSFSTVVRSAIGCGAGAAPISVSAVTERKYVFIFWVSYFLG
jgi:hypothetical protein